MQSKNVSKIDQAKSMFKAAVDVLLPSALGTAVYIVVFAITAVVNQPSQYKDTWRTVYFNDLHQSFIYHYAGNFNNLVRTQAANTLALYVFWGLIGIGVFAVGVRLTNNFNELAEDISLRNYIWPKGADRNSPLKAFAERVAYHVFMAIVFFIYLSRALPWLATQWQNDQAGLDLSSSTLKHYAVLFVYEFIILHLAVVILRFLFLRRRLLEY